MKLWVAILWLVVLIGLGVGYWFSIQKDPSAAAVQDESGCPFGRSDPITSKDFSYTDADRGYTFKLPAGYTVPEMGGAEGNDPHFYDCGTGHWFELQIGLEDYAALTLAQQSDVAAPTTLFPGATVTGGSEDAGGESWAYWYIVSYPEQKRAFRLGTNRPLEEYPFFASFNVF